MSEKTLEERTQRKILERAFIRWESAGILLGSAALTAVAYAVDTDGQFLNLIPHITWLGFGVVGYGAMVWSSLTDKKANAKVVEQLLQSQYKPKDIRNKHLRRRVEKALSYRTHITEQINDEPEDSAMRVQLQSVASQMDDWIEEIYDLAMRLDNYMTSQRGRLRTSKEEAQQRISKLVRRLQTAGDERVREDINQSIANLNRQIDSIESLHRTMERAELRLENTITAMATIDSQTILLDAKDIDSSRFKRLQQEISDEVNELADVLSAMDDVYSEGG